MEIKYCAVAIYNRGYFSCIVVKINVDQICEKLIYAAGYSLLILQLSIKNNESDVLAHNSPRMPVFSFVRYVQSSCFTLFSTEIPGIF